jgi:HPt (histidine-containing phosphotransfer) domain-containing protein
VAVDPPSRVVPALTVADFAKARETMDDDRALFDELAQMCLHDVPLQFAQLEQARAAGDHGAVREVAHAIKGMVSMFGADRTVQAAVKIERMAADALPPADAVAELQAAITDFAAALSTYRW